MIDLHNHALYGIDDGCKDVSQSLSLLKDAFEQGVTDIVLTPHFILDGSYHENSLEVLKRMNELQTQCFEAGYNIMLHPGHELFIHRLLPECLKEKRCCSLANSRYVLVEFPFDEYQEEYDYVLEDLRALGYIIIVAHPERYLYVQKDVNFCLRWLERGDLLQCNQNSLLRKDTSKLVKVMLKHHLVSFIASDAHGNKRPVSLDNAYHFICKSVGMEIAERLMHIHPEKVLKDEMIVNDEYEPVKKFFGIF